MKYIVTKGIYKDHKFNGEETVIDGKKRVIDKDSQGRSYPIINVKELNNLKEFIDSDNKFISGDKPQYSTDQITNTKTTDELSPMVQIPNSLLNPFNFGLGYMLENEKVDENLLPKKIYDEHDVLDKEETTELPDIYSLTNLNLVSKLKTLVTTLNADDNEIDKVAIFADFIKRVDLSNVSAKYKKELVKIIKAKF